MTFEITHQSPTYNIVENSTDGGRVEYDVYSGATRFRLEGKDDIKAKGNRKIHVLFNEDAHTPVREGIAPRGA